MRISRFRNSSYSFWSLLQRPFFAYLAISAKLHPLCALKGRKQMAIGEGSRIGAHCTIVADQPSSFVKIGARCLIGPFAILMTYGGTIHIGNDCSVNPFCVLYGHGGLKIGNGVRIASGAVIIPANHNYSDPDVPIHRQGVSAVGITIEDDVWVGANVTLLDGVRVGTGSIIAAGAVLTCDVEPFTIVGGVPARLIKRRK
jgi:acetyltransferase-like isoleucine patch superfamily enzyme